MQQRLLLVNEFSELKVPKVTINDLNDQHALMLFDSIRSIISNRTCRNLLVFFPGDEFSFPVG